MRPLRPRLWLSLIICCFLQTHAFALVAPKPSPSRKNVAGGLPQQLVLRPSLSPAVASKHLGANAMIRLDKRTGAARLLTGHFGVAVDLSQSKKSTLTALVQESLAFVGANPDVFGSVTSDMLRLDERAVLLNKSEQFLKFRVYQAGILVEDAVVDFRFKFGQLVQVYNQSFGELKFIAPAQKQNTTRALAAFKSPHLQASKFRVLSTAKAYATVLVDSYSATLDGEPYDVQVSAADGSIIEAKLHNHYLSAQAHGQYYRRYYKEDLIEDVFSELDVTTAEGQTTTTGVDGRFDATPDFNPFVLGLRGPKVNVLTETGSLLRRDGSIVDGAARLSINFGEQGETAVHADKDVAQAMAFRHTTDMVNYARRYLDTPWFNARLTANANLADSCNAHWDGTTINFYSADTRCANTGLISDVVFHEWGHGLDENTGGIEDDAYSEGFGDIMSLLMTRSNILGIGFMLNGKPVRDLEPDVNYPTEDHEVHHEGLVIASTFWDLYKLMRDKHGDDQAINILSSYAFKMIVTASRYTDVYDALLVIDDNDAKPSNGSPNKCIINEAFSSHGLTARDVSCLLGDVTDFTLNDISGNRNGIIEPGEEVAINVSLLNHSGLALSDVSAEVSVEAATSGIMLSQNTLHWPEMQPNQTVVSSDALNLAIARDVACGSNFNLKFAIKGGGRDIVLRRNIQAGRFVGEASAYGTTTLPLDITDNSSVSAPITVGGWDAANTIAAAHLKFDITHPYTGDLAVSLVSPSGDVVEVYRGSNGDDDVHFDRDVSKLLIGKKGLGEWQLKVEDKALRDVGTLDSLSLTLTPSIYECH